MMHVFYTQLVTRAHHKPLMIDALALFGIFFVAADGVAAVTAAAVLGAHPSRANLQSLRLTDISG